MEAVDNLTKKLDVKHKKQNADIISDLDGIDEEVDSDAESNIIRSKKDATEFIFETLISAEMNRIAQASLKISNFVLNCVLKQRLYKKKTAIVTI